MQYFVNSLLKCSDKRERVKKLEQFRSFYFCHFSWNNRTSAVTLDMKKAKCCIAQLRVEEVELSFEKHILWFKNIWHHYQGKQAKNCIIQRLLLEHSMHCWNVTLNWSSINEQIFFMFLQCRFWFIICHFCEQIMWIYGALFN